MGCFSRGEQQSPSLKEHEKLHYGWIIVATGTAVLFACLGLGRLSLGMLLPSMGLSLDLNYSQMGLIGTGNFAGYMGSIVLAGFLAKAIGARWTVSIGLVLVGASMILISRAAGHTEVMMLYVATGIGSGLANIPMMGLVSHWFAKSNRGRAAGMITSGNGIAIVCTGLLIPWVNSSMGAEGWRAGWLIIGVTSLVVAAVAANFLRNDPAEKGIAPLGVVREVADISRRPVKDIQETGPWTMVHLGFVYAFFGASYAVYFTFIVVDLVGERGFGENAAGLFWAVVGGLSILSGPVYGLLSDRLGRKFAMMLAYAMFAISYALAAMDLPIPFLYASIAIFGLTVWSVPTIMSAAVGDYAGPLRAAKALGFITLFFGFGQIVGPYVAGLIADTSGSFRIAFWLCAILSLTAMFLSWFLRPASR